MKPVGLDLSLTSTGISCEDTREVFASKLRGMPRIDEISNLVFEFIRLEQNPAVIVEGYSFSSKNSHAHALGELGGVIRHRLWKNQIPWVDVPPTSRAKFATGKGNASKSEVVSSVSARTGIIFAGAGGDDLCDAWVLEEMGRQVLGVQRHEWPAVNLTALEKVDWSPLGIN